MISVTALSTGSYGLIAFPSYPLVHPLVYVGKMHVT